MKLIQLQYQGNFRYLLFIVNDQYYLIDRRPSHFIAYFLLPLNWFFYHKVYLITTEEYLKLKEKHARTSKIVIPASLVGGATVLFNTWLRVNNIDIFKNFYTDFSMMTNCILLAIGMVVAFLLLQLLYYSRRKSLQVLLDRELKQPFYYKIQPEKTVRFFFYMLGLQTFGIAITILFVVAFLYLENIAMLLATILMSFLCFVVANGALSDNNKWKYKIVDTLKTNLEKR